MVISDTAFWKTRKSAFRLDHTGEATPRSVQIAGSDPAMMADAARMNAERGAQIIDINMGCPAKKVCNRAAGSALMREPELVKEILEAVVNAVDLPVTLKMRTGWCPESRNGIELARMAEAIGIQALAVHGRTRADGYRGEAEYDTLARIRDVIQIPLFANGDIDSPEKAHQVLRKTGADAVMIGRAAQGRPWLFREIDHYLRTGQTHPAAPQDEISTIMQQHLQALHRFYGEVLGLRIARKHIGWYLQHFEQGQAFRKSFNTIESVERQSSALADFLAEQRRTAA
ncbi:tRNA dihydrouridine synthase B [Nitrincola lacisaponensis]|uniref:tRNA-dihydrouridine synthase n=2 Tax=Nitrincola lacisaponensis TaxID=267850 RepID=A0A063Y4V6_9GAMM|nr:tRNA dihydrouridine synthase B [Nitrincola lacisaponensis]